MTTPDLATSLRALRDGGRKLLVPYITGGYPGWQEAIRACAANGADAAQSDGKDAPEDGTVDEDATESRDPALLLPRMRHVRALESSKRAARDALDANRVALLRDMSAKLVDPRMRVI